MKITAIGVHSAFAVGSYDDVIPVDQVRELMRKVASSPKLQEPSDDMLEAELAKYRQCRYRPKWQSNFLLEFDMPSKRNGTPPYRLMLDIGGDARHALANLGLSSADIDGIYISHPHNDHIGGMEYMGLTTLFNPSYTVAKEKWLDGQFIAAKLFLDQKWPQGPIPEAKPDIFIHRKVLDPLKMAVAPGLDTVQGVPHVSLETYFDIHVIGKQENGETKTWTFQDGEGEWTITPVFAMHVISSSEEMASYGLSLEYAPTKYNILMPTDTQHMMPPQLELHYQRANRIYMDCETTKFPSGVHPHVSDLIHRMAPEIQKKCLLYHYTAYPDVPEGMFYGILHAGDSHTYPE
jgi:hypothetical protein